MGKGKAKKQKKEQDQEKVENKSQVVEQSNEKENIVQIIEPKKVQYCPICTLPFQLCKYGKGAKDCRKFLQEIAPTKVSKYHPDAETNTEQVGQIKVEEAEPIKQKSKKDKSLKQKYIVITVKERMKKKFITTVSGLLNFKIDAKELTKKLSKKFACSCSVQDPNQIQAQGDFEQDLRQILKEDYAVKKKYILGKDQFQQKQTEEKQKKKAQKAAQKNIIPEEPEQQQEEPEGQKKNLPNGPEVKEIKEEEQQPKYKTQFQAALADCSDQDDDS